MPVDIFSKKNIILFAIILLIVLVGGFYLYPFSTSEESSNATMDTSLLEQRVKDFIAAKGGIDLKDRAIFSSTLYSQLEDYSEDIPMSAKRGRPNPFIPYVAP